MNGSESATQITINDGLIIGMLFNQNTIVATEEYICGSVNCF